MKVKELIEGLRKLDQDAEGNEGSCNLLIEWERPRKQPSRNLPRSPQKPSKKFAGHISLRRTGKGNPPTEPHDTTSYEVSEGKNAPRRKPRRRALRRYDRLGVGRHSERAMAGMYRRAGVTPDQLATELGVSEAAARKTLQGLAANNLARKSAINPWWGDLKGRPPELWFLKAEGVAYGAALNGVENPRRARRDHGRANLPAHTAHVDLRNG